MNRLPVQRFQFVVELDTPLQLNFYSGSTLRGAFGEAFRSVACVNSGACGTACLQPKACQYAAIFEAQSVTFQQRGKPTAIQKPYVIEPPQLGVGHYAAGEVLQFGMVLIGDAIAEIEAVIAAWQRAFARGLGKKLAGTGRLLSVVAVAPDGRQSVVYARGVFVGLPVVALPRLVYAAMPVAVELVFETPVKIKKEGRAVQGPLGAADFLMRLVSRFYSLVEFYGQDYVRPDFAVLQEQIGRMVCEGDFSLLDWERYSNRQAQRVPVAGLLGTMRLTGAFSPALLDILYMGQWVHVGSHATFGLGKYRLVLVNASEL